MLKISNITKNYSGKPAVNNISLEIPRGQIVGLFGENGAGKTTLMKAALGLIRCRGTVSLDGEAISKDNIDKLSFATCEHSFFPTLTPEAHRVFYMEHFPSFDDKRFNALMEFFNLPKNRAVGKFSVGMQNQFEVVMALSQGADYILMDEPFAGNDVFNREDFYKVLLGILTENETVIISTHLIEEVKDIISRAILIHQGEIVGDCSIDELEDRGLDLISYVKQTYNYRGDRVTETIQKLSGEEE